MNFYPDFFNPLKLLNSPLITGIKESSKNLISNLASATINKIISSFPEEMQADLIVAKDLYFSRQIDPLKEIVVRGKEKQIRNKIFLARENILPREEWIESELQFLEKENQIQQSKTLRIEINKALLTDEFENILFNPKAQEENFFQLIDRESLRKTSDYQEKVRQRFAEIVQKEVEGRKVNYEPGKSSKEDLPVFLQDILKKDFFLQSPANFRKKLENLAYQARLEAANIQGPLAMEKCEVAMRMRKTLWEKFTSIRATIPTDFMSNTGLDRAPLEKEIIQTLYEKNRNALFNHLKGFQQIFSHQIRDFLTSDKTSVSEFELFFTQKEKTMKEELDLFLCKDFAKELAFYSSWGDYLKTEVIQGFENENEVLMGGGVCFAFCYRLQTFGRGHPAITESEFAKQIKVMPADRFQQVKYRMGTTEFLKKSERFDLCDLSNFEDYCNDPSFLDKIPHGWTNIALIKERHAVNLCLDKTQNRIWFIDPNLGFFSFGKESRSFEDSKKQFFKFFQELINLNYSSINQLGIYQFAK